MAHIKTALKQINIITVKEYMQSNKELSEDIPGNSMSIDEYINMVLGQYLDEGNKKVESVELFYLGIEKLNEAQELYEATKSLKAEQVFKGLTPIAAIHYTQYI